MIMFNSIAACREALASREVSAVELATSCLNEIDRLHDTLNAFLSLDPEGAIAQAEAADRSLAKGAEMPLLGVPISLKDLIDQAGKITTAGSRALDPLPAARDATLVAKLRQAGAVILGRNNLHEFAFGTTNENAHYGPVHNPWRLGFVPGGSSGGSASAVASGLGLASIGTDTGGSVRIPASLCGISGFKGTYGRVSRYGVFPLAWSADHPGPLARSIEDCALLMEVMSGHDVHDPVTVDTPEPRFVDASRLDCSGLRVGIVTGGPAAVLDSGVAASFEAAAAVLRGVSKRCSEIEFAELAEGPVLSQLILSAEAATVHWDRVTTRPEGYGEAVRQRLRLGQLLPAPAYIDAQRARRQLVNAVSAIFQEFDVIVLPTAAVPAFPIGSATVPLGGKDVAVGTVLTRFTSVFNLTGVPALSVPCGFTPDGLPVGLQMAAKAWNEDAIFALAGEFQRRTDWHLRRPTVQ